MPNSWFRFKQFIIHQDKTAMKVGTDGVLLGAWANCEQAQHILDIGCGTGLLSLMCAQRSKAAITGVEIEPMAAEQASENVRQSTFYQRIRIVHQDIHSFARATQHQYDYIICNPPYFNSTSSQAGEPKKLARQQYSLNYDSLIEICSKLISFEGKFGIVFPFEHQAKVLQQISLYEFFILRKTTVYPSPNKAPRRILLECSKTFHPTREYSLCIETGQRHHYSHEFKELTKDFYL